MWGFQENHYGKGWRKNRMYKLEYAQLRQQDTQLCWQAVTNIFSRFYRGEDYLIGPPGENVPAVAETAIELATNRSLLDVSMTFQEIQNKIMQNHLLYACLDYSGSGHSVVIVGVDDPNLFCIYDPMEGFEAWYSFGASKRYRDAFSGSSFTIYKIAALT